MKGKRQFVCSINRRKRTVSASGRLAKAIKSAKSEKKRLRHFFNSTFGCGSIRHYVDDMCLGCSNAYAGECQLYQLTKETEEEGELEKGKEQ